MGNQVCLPIVNRHRVPVCAICEKEARKSFRQLSPAEKRFWVFSEGQVFCTKCLITHRIENFQKQRSEAYVKRVTELVAERYARPPRQNGLKKVVSGKAWHRTPSFRAPYRESRAVTEKLQRYERKFSGVQFHDEQNDIGDVGAEGESEVESERVADASQADSSEVDVDDGGNLQEKLIAGSSSSDSTWRSRDPFDEELEEEGVGASVACVRPVFGMEDEDDDCDSVYSDDLTLAVCAEAEGETSSGAANNGDDRQPEMETVERVNSGDNNLEALKGRAVSKGSSGFFENLADSFEEQAEARRREGDGKGAASADAFCLGLEGVVEVQSVSLTDTLTSGSEVSVDMERARV